MTRTNRWVLALLLLVALSLPLYASDTYIYMSGLVVVSAIAILGLNYILSNTGLISVGHAAIQGIGAYTAAVLADHFGLPFLVVFMAGAVASVVVGLIIALPSVRLTGPYFAITTLALGWAVPEVILVLGSMTGGYTGIFVKPVQWVGSPATTVYYLGIVTFLLAVWVQRNLDRSKFGRAVLLIKQNRAAAQTVGIDVVSTQVLAVTFGNLVVGISGVLLLYLVSDISPETFGFMQSAYFLAGSVIGGIGPIGAIIGSAVIVLVPQLFSSMQNLSSILLGLIMFVSLVGLPGGLTSLRRPTRLSGHGTRLSRLIRSTRP